MKVVWVLYFLLQFSDTDFKGTDMYIIKELLDSKDRVHDVKYVPYSDLDIELDTGDIPIEEVIPVGSLKYVRKYLSKVHNISNMNCIEVPNELRDYRYLKRKYAIIPKSELPKEGYYFLKYASSLKDFTYRGRLEYLSADYIEGEPYLKDGLYVLSEYVDILSEYRCFIVDDVIEGIQFYDGDCTVMPTPYDISLLKEMVFKYSLNLKRPRAYTMDIAIIKDRGLAILEVHPHTSVGLYGFNKPVLP